MREAAAARSDTVRRVRRLLLDEKPRRLRWVRLDGVVWRYLLGFVLLLLVLALYGGAAYGLAVVAPPAMEPKLGPAKPDALGTPDVLLMRSDELVVFDALRATMTIVVHADPASPASLARAQARLDAIEAQLAQPVPALPIATGPIPEFVSGFGEAAFKQGIAKIKDYIAAGDVMQVVPSQRMSAPFTAPPVTLYRALRRLNPSPYLYCLNLDDHHVVGSSPEILVRAEHGEVRSAALFMSPVCRARLCESTELHRPERSDR